MVEMQFPDNNSSSRALDFNCLPAPPSADHNEREVLFDSNNSISMSDGSDLV